LQWPLLNVAIFDSLCDLKAIKVKVKA